MFKIICIGAGGTGGYFLKEFSRFLPGSMKRVAGLYVIDGDTVEEHNLTRQCFQEEDVGSSKATVLAEILNDAFHLYWRSFPTYLTNVAQLEDIIKLETNEIPIILGCVDNHGCRLILEDFFRKHKNCIYFDSANEFISGEVIMSFKINNRQLSPLRSEVFSDILKGDLRNVTELSCEELNVSSPQHISVNMMAGLILLSAVSQLLTDNIVKPGMVSFNAQSFSQEYFPMSYSN